jgi:hypothetical protein
VGSSAISQPRTPAQKRARRSGSFASKQSAKRREVIPLRISDLLTHSRRQGTSSLPMRNATLGARGLPRNAHESEGDAPAHDRVCVAAHRDLVGLQVDVHSAGASEHRPLAGDVRRRLPRPGQPLRQTGVEAAGSPDPRRRRATGRTPAPPLPRPLAARGEVSRPP